MIILLIKYNILIIEILDEGEIILEIRYEIADDKVRNFTDSAKNRIQEQSQKYALEIISEAEKVEEFLRENGASTEITENIIFQAVRRNKTEKKKNVKFIITRIISEIFLFISGLMFLPEMFITEEKTLNLGYFIIFLIVTLIAFVMTIVTYFIRGE